MTARLAGAAADIIRDLAAEKYPGVPLRTVKAQRDFPAAHVEAGDQVVYALTSPTTLQQVVAAMVHGEGIVFGRADEFPLAGASIRGVVVAAAKPTEVWWDSGKVNDAEEDDPNGDAPASDEEAKCQ